MKYGLFLPMLLLVGCFGPIKITVYGKSGSAYVAPDLCSAILNCQKAGESACMYADYETTDAQGNKVESKCKVVPSK